MQHARWGPLMWGSRDMQIFRGQTTGDTKLGVQKNSHKIAHSCTLDMFVSENFRAKKIGKFDSKMLSWETWDSWDTTLLRSGISPPKALLKMMFLFARWDMLVSGCKTCPLNASPTRPFVSATHPWAPLLKNSSSSQVQLKRAKFQWLLVVCRLGWIIFEWRKSGQLKIYQDSTLLKMFTFKKQAELSKLKNLLKKYRIFPAWKCVCLS